MVPFVLLAWRHAGAAAHEDARRRLRVLVPLVALTIAAGAARLAVLWLVENPGEARVFWDRRTGRARGPRAVHSPVARFPRRANPVFHAVAPVESLASARAAGAMALLLILGAAAWRLRRHEPIAAFGLAWFALFVSVLVLVVVDLGEPMAEQRIDLASAGIFMIAGTSLAVCALTRVRPAWRMLPVALAGRRRGRALRGDRQARLDAVGAGQVWEDAAGKAPGAWVPLVMLGMLSMRDGRAADAIERYRRAAAIAPDQPMIDVKVGALAMQAGDRKEAARRAFETAVRLDPSSTTAQNALGALALTEGRPAEARVHLEGALRAYWSNVRRGCCWPRSRNTRDSAPRRACGASRRRRSRRRRPTWMPASRGTRRTEVLRHIRHHMHVAAADVDLVLEPHGDARRRERLVRPRRRRCRSPSRASSLPEGSTITVSPLLEHAATRSARRSRGSRGSGAARTAPGSGSRRGCDPARSARSRGTRATVVALVPAVFALFCTTLSPLSALIGMKVTSLKPSCPTNAPKSLADRVVDRALVALEVHLVHGHEQVRDAEQRRDVRVPRDCWSTPSRASIRMIATFAVDAPVAMLRVYCTWPGVSAMMNLRFCGREVAVRDVDRDALLALGLEAVGEAATSRSPRPRAFAALLHRRELIVVDAVGVVAAAARSAWTCRRRPSRPTRSGGAPWLRARRGRPRCRRWISSCSPAIRSSPRASSAPSSRPRRGR